MNILNLFKQGYAEKDKANQQDEQQQESTEKDKIQDLSVDEQLQLITEALQDIDSRLQTLEGNTKDAEKDEAEETEEGE